VPGSGLSLTAIHFQMGRAFWNSHAARWMCIRKAFVCRAVPGPSI